MKSFKMIVLLIMTVLLVACGNEFKGDFAYDVQNFSYVNQEGESVTLSDLEGTVWLADFIFTNCDTVCPPMTANMSKIQAAVEEEGIKNVRFISFSVDPEVDSPEVLKVFGDQFQADYSNWDFLTGYSQDEIATLARESFKSIVQADPNSDQVIHYTSFYLVDQNGQVVKMYKGATDVPYEEIIEDLKLITN